MSKWTLDVTESDVDDALEAAKNLRARPAAISAEYNREVDLVILHLDNSQRLVIPREQLEALQDATAEQLAQIEIFSGVDIAWPQLDVDYYLPYLLEGKYATEKRKKKSEQRGVAA